MPPQLTGSRRGAWYEFIMVSSYFDRRDPGISMPKRLPGSLDECGIRYEGGVSNGELSVQEAFSLQANGLIQQRSQQGGSADASLDPVLRYHLGLDSKP